MAFALSCMMVVGASAQDRDRDDQNRHVDQNRDHDRNQDRWETRKGWEYRTYRNDQRPEGWEQGRRSEWRNCDDGTGGRQYECYSYQYQGQPYYYYRDDNGNVYVRRQHRDHDHDHDHDHDQH